jgi:hypothetical protein
VACKIVDSAIFILDFNGELIVESPGVASIGIDGDCECVLFAVDPWSRAVEAEADGSTPAVVVQVGDPVAGFGGEIGPGMPLVIL